MNILTLINDKTEWQEIQKMLDNFCDLTGLAAVINDKTGCKLTEVSNISNYCSIMRTQGDKCCKSDEIGAEVAANIGETCVYICHAGLVDFAIPIFVDGEHVGSIMAGQVRSREKISYDFSTKAMVDLLQDKSLKEKYEAIPFMNQKQIEKSARVLEIIRKYIVERIENNRKEDRKAQWQQKEKTLELFQTKARQIADTMRSVDYERARQLLDKLCEDFLSSKNNKVDEQEFKKIFVNQLKNLELSIPDERMLMKYDDLIIIHAEEQREYFYKLFDWMFNEIIMSKRFRVRDEMDYAIAYTQRFYYKRISIRQISEFVNRSPDYFARLFKRRFGIKYSDYITEKRIAISKELLLKREYTVNEIAITLGFTEAGYFTRVFKKYTGQSPSEFRKEITLVL